MARNQSGRLSGSIWRNSNGDVLLAQHDRRALHPRAGLEAHQKIFRHDVLAGMFCAGAPEMARDSTPPHGRIQAGRPVFTLSWLRRPGKWASIEALRKKSRKSKGRRLNEKIEGIHRCRTGARRHVRRPGPATTGGAAATAASAEHDVLCHRRRARQGRRSRRHRGRRPALPEVGAAPRRGRKDLARLSEHPGGRRQAGRQCTRPHRQRSVAELQGHGRRDQRRRSAQRQQQARLRQLAVRARLHHSRRGLRAEPSRRADRLDQGRPRLPGR